MTVAAAPFERFHQVAVTYTVDLTGEIVVAQAWISYWPAIGEEVRVVAERPFGACAGERASEDPGDPTTKARPDFEAMFARTDRFIEAVPFIAAALAKALPADIEDSLCVRVDVTHAVRDEDGSVDDVRLWGGLVEDGVWVVAGVVRPDGPRGALSAEVVIGQDRGTREKVIADRWTELLLDPDLDLRRLLAVAG